MRLHAALISFLATAGIVVHSQAANQEENPSQQVEMPRFAVIIPITDVFIAGKSRRATMSTEASKEIIHRKLAEALCQLPDKVCRKTVDSENLTIDCQTDRLTLGRGALFNELSRGASRRRFCCWAI